jgi:hypothetical protein
MLCKGTEKLKLQKQDDKCMIRGEGGIRMKKGIATIGIVGLLVIGGFFGNLVSVEGLSLFGLREGNVTPQIGGLSTNFVYEVFFL